MPLATPDTTYQISDDQGQELLRIDKAGNFFVRGEEVASTSIIRDAFKNYADLYTAEQLRFQNIITIRSSLPAILAQFPSEEARQTPEFRAALLHAQINPTVDYNYTGEEVNVHVVIGLLEELKTMVLRNKFDFEQAQIAMARQLREQSQALNQQVQPPADPTGAPGAEPGDPNNPALDASTTGDATASDASSASSTSETPTSPEAGEIPATSSGDENNANDGPNEAQ